MSSTMPLDCSGISLCQTCRSSNSGSRHRLLSARDVLIIGGVVAGIAWLYITSCAVSRPGNRQSERAGAGETCGSLELSRPGGRDRVLREQLERDCEGVMAEHPLWPGTA